MVSFVDVGRCLPVAAVASSCEYNSRYLGEHAFPPARVRRGSPRYKRRRRYTSDHYFPDGRDRGTTDEDAREAHACTRVRDSNGSDLNHFRRLTRDTITGPRSQRTRTN